MSAQTLLNASGQIDYGVAKGSLLATGVATLVAGTVIVTPGGPVLASQSIVAVPASAVANANAGALTVAVASATTFTITSANNLDVGVYRWFQFA